MQLYNCTVQLNGEIKNAVFKTDVTAAEIVLLKHIHGQSEHAAAPVVNIVAFDLVDGPKDPDTDTVTKIQIPKGSTKRTDVQERARLSAIYSHGELGGARLIAEVLGVAGVPLPKLALDTDGREIVAPPMPEQPLAAAEIDPSVKRTRILRNEAQAVVA